MELQGKGLGLVAIDLPILSTRPAVGPEQQPKGVASDGRWRFCPPPLPPRSVCHLTAGAHRWFRELNQQKPIVVIVVLIWLRASSVFLTRYLGSGVLQSKGGDGDVGRTPR